MSQILHEPGKKPFSTYRSYQRIENDLREQIAAGRWQAGVALPTRQDLARQYGVDRNTLQRAINALLADGTLVSNGVRGTFVTTSPIITSTMQRFVKPRAFDPGQMPFSETAVRKTGAIYGIIINSPRLEDFHDVWYDRIVHAAERTSTGSGSATRFGSVLNSRLSFFDGISAEIRTMVAGDTIAGLIVVSIHDDDQSISIDRLMQQYQLPIVYVSSVEAECPVPHVYYDQVEAGFQAARHVINQGHSAMTFVSPVDMMWVRARIKGAQSACRLAGLPEPALTVYPSVIPDDINPHIIMGEGYNRYSELFSSTMPSAIIGCNDIIALKVKHAGERAGKVAGRDYLLMGFDDNPESRAMGLTTLSPPLEDLGEEAANLLPHLIDGTRPGSQVRLRSHLVQRASSGA